MDLQKSHHLRDTSLKSYLTQFQIVYIRDAGDYRVVNRLFEERFPEVPKVIVVAAVCRPGWLVEMECIALKEQVCPEFDNF